MGRGGPLGGMVTSTQSCWPGFRGNGLLAVSGMKYSTSEGSGIWLQDWLVRWVSSWTSRGLLGVVLEFWD